MFVNRFAMLFFYIVFKTEHCFRIDAEGGGESKFAGVSGCMKTSGFRIGVGKGEANGSAGPILFENHPIPLHIPDQVGKPVLRLRQSFHECRCFV